MVTFVSALVAGCSPAPVEEAPKAATPPPREVPVSPALLAEGADVYENHCALCHYAGEGNEVNPALIGSAVVAGPAAGTINVILKGRQGESVVNGQKLNGIMPAQDFLTDEEIAAVVTYVRKEFGPGGSAVTPKEVAAQR